MVLTNFVGNRDVIDAIEARTRDVTTRYDAATLSTMMMRFDERGKNLAASDPRTLEGGRSAVVFFRRGALNARSARPPAEPPGCQLLLEFRVRR